jgi:hypothetical protein
MLADRTFEISLATYANESPDQPVHEVKERSYTEFLHRLVPEDTEKPHPWLNLFLPDDETESLIADFTATGGDVGPAGELLVYPFDPSLTTAPAIGLPTSTVVFLVGLLRTAESPTSLARMVAANRRWRQRTLDVGGRVYLDRSGTP